MQSPGLELGLIHCVDSFMIDEPQDHPISTPTPDQPFPPTTPEYWAFQCMLVETR